MGHFLFDEPRRPGEDEDAYRRRMERGRRAAEARLTEQPNVYVSVSGLRYRCCGNIPDDEDEYSGHGPWCTG